MGISQSKLIPIAGFTIFNSSAHLKKLKSVHHELLHRLGLWLGCGLSFASRISLRQPTPGTPIISNSTSHISTTPSIVPLRCPCSTSCPNLLHPRKTCLLSSLCTSCPCSCTKFRFGRSFEVHPTLHAIGKAILRKGN